MKHENTIAGILLLGFCAIAYWLTMGFGSVSPMLAQNVPPTFFPRVVLFILAVLSGILIFTGIGRKPKSAEFLPASFWKTVGIIISTGVLAYFLGILITLAVIAVVLPIAWGERRYRLIATLAIFLPISIYIVFTLGLDVRFPAGRVLDAVL
jgi:putative tricarboxylic transport membrane protein|tara:strand:+ start:282 stop:737 length:456 start_codon:yes stop_codon:yes gene_type:complete